ILSDVLMPGLDGFELCLAVRREAPLAAIPVVLASAYYREAEDDALARKVGANALVVRSPDSGDLVRAVQAELGSAAPALPAESPGEIAEAHRRRMVQQLERQAIANAG